MKIKDFLDNLPENIVISGLKSLVGVELKVLEPYFDNIDELKGKNIQIIEGIRDLGYSFINGDNGLTFKGRCSPNLLTINGFETLGNNIKIYSIFMQGNDVFVRCTEDSINNYSDDK